MIIMMTEEETRVRMKAHVDEYMMFYRVCADKEVCDEAEILAMWQTWNTIKR